MYWQMWAFAKWCFPFYLTLTFGDFFAIPGIIEAVPLGAFRRIWISGVHAINFFELSRNPLDLRSRDIMWLLQRACFLAAWHYVFSQRVRLWKAWHYVLGVESPCRSFFSEMSWDEIMSLAEKMVCLRQKPEICSEILCLDSSELMS